MNRYADAHASRNGPEDSRPSALQVVQDEANDRAARNNPLPNLVIIITGATSGIGFETAKALYHTGARILITARDAEKGQEAIQKIQESVPYKNKAKNNIEAIVMELDSLESVRSAAEEILRRVERVNILINNAGVARVPFRQTRDGFEQHWGINYAGHFFLTHELLPVLIKSSSPNFASRIVNITNTGHRLFLSHLQDRNFERTKYEPFSAYSTSKLAIIYHSNYIDRHFSLHGVHAVAVHPGTIRDTNMINSLDNERVSFDEIAGYREELKSVSQGAATTVWAAISSSKTRVVCTWRTAQLVGWKIKAWGLLMADILPLFSAGE